MSGKKRKREDPFFTIPRPLMPPFPLPEEGEELGEEEARRVFGLFCAMLFPASDAHPLPFSRDRYRWQEEELPGHLSCRPDPRAFFRLAPMALLRTYPPFLAQKRAEVEAVFPAHLWVLNRIASDLASGRRGGEEVGDLLSPPPPPAPPQLLTGVRGEGARRILAYLGVKKRGGD